MNRVTLNLLTALPLVLLVGVALWWARSYAPRDFTLGAHDGNVLLLFTDGQWTMLARPRGQYSTSLGDVWLMGQAQAAAQGSFLGVSYAARRTQTGPGGGGNAGRFVMVAVPFGYPAALAAAAAAWALVARARLVRRARLGACRRCGYDLTGNVSGTCPECGAAAGGKAVP